MAYEVSLQSWLKAFPNLCVLWVEPVDELVNLSCFPVVSVFVSHRKKFKQAKMHRVVTLLVGEMDHSKGETNLSGPNGGSRNADDAQ